MKLIIDENILGERGLTLTEYLYLLIQAKGGDINDCIPSLISKGWCNRDLFDDTKVVLSDNAKNEVMGILVDSAKAPDITDNEFLQLADKLRELYPKGKKAGTSYMWRDTTASIARKLKTLVVKYNFRFTEEQAINATKAYITSFNGDYRYMQLLKYFLLKTVRTANDDVEIRSEFMSYIQNEGQEDQRDWVNELA